MKRCPVCHQSYSNEDLKFCRQDGALLSDEDLAPTEILSPASQGLKTSSRPLQHQPSIAVLPFAHLSSDLDNEYFCDGLAEELLNALAKIEDLKVAARTSAFSFKDKRTTIGEIGRALNVNTLLVGSVRKSGSQVRIMVQLVNAADGFHLWSERYEREVKNIFDVQDEITLAVVEKLKIKLLGDQKEVLKREPVDAESYELFLKGLNQARKYTAEGWQRAIEYFDKAIEREPGFAAAFGGKARCQHYLYYYSIGSPTKIIDDLLHSTHRALELDERVAEAHLSLADYCFYYERDWARAEVEFKRAIELNPNSASAHQFYGLFLAARERFDEAIREARLALELDPLSLVINLHVGWVYWFAGQFDKTLSQIERMIELEPNFFGAYWQLGTLHSVRGNAEAAVEAFQKALAEGETQLVLSFLGSGYALAGRREEALAVIDQLLEMRKSHFTAAFNIARVYSGLGEVDKAYEWLEESLSERDGELVFLKVASSLNEGLLWGKIRGAHETRFQDFLQRIEVAVGTNSQTD